MKKNNEQSIKDVLGEMYNLKKLKPKLDQLKVKTLWKEMMGESINKYTRSIALRNGRLIVQIESAPLRQELSYGKEKIKKMMNEKIGEQVVETVILK